MDLPLRKGIILLSVTAWLMTNCSGQDFCNQGLTYDNAKLQSVNFPNMGEQVSCRCVLQNSNNHPVAVDMTIRFTTEDNDNPCDQRLVMAVRDTPISVCPSEEHTLHKTAAHLVPGQSMMLHTLGTPGKMWSLKFQYTASMQLDLFCSSSTNATQAPACPCGASRIVELPPGLPAASDQGLGTRLGIGFGVVLGLLAVIALIVLLLFFLKRRKRGASETKPEYGNDHMRRPAQSPPNEKPGLDQENNPVIMDPMKAVPPGYPVYADVDGQPINTNMAYMPDEHTQHPGFTKSSDSGLNSLQNSQENLSNRPPSYNYYPGYGNIPPQPVSSAPDPSALYARPNKNRQPGRLSLTGQGATGSHDPVYPLGPGYEDNEVYVTDTSGSHNTSQNYVQTQV